MTAGTRPRENEEQRTQIHRSAIRIFGMWVTSDAGERVWVRIAGFAFGMFMLMIGLRAGADEWSHRTYAATVTNRCLGVAILAELDPQAWQLPPWCPALLVKMRDEPPAEHPK